MILAPETKKAQGRRGMVSTAEPLATQVGVDILKRGGNAVDAAIAVGFALAVTYPRAGNLGGGGFMLVHTPGGKHTAVDYREMAPAAATRNIYLDAGGNPIVGEGGSLVGYRAPGVPGTVAGFDYAFRRYGSKRLRWADLIEPARRLAADGFLVSRSLARSLEREGKLLGQYAESRRIFLNNGKGFREGDRLRQPELGETLARIARHGAREFYQGETARRIAAAMRHGKGLITLRDLQSYAVRERVPLVGSYRGRKIITMPPPSSGGIALLQMLGMLEAFDLREMGAMAPQRYHLLVEAMRRAFADRAEFLGDPDFIRIPVRELLDPAYIAARRADISLERASSSKTTRAGHPGGAAPTSLPHESTETTHYTVMDAEGGAVSNTYTLNGNYGSGVTLAGTGILMNNEMDDFAVKPGVPNQFGLIQSARNAVGPGRRPLSSMTPTFVLNEKGGVLLAVGSPGGPTIINTVVQVVLNVLDHGMGAAEAVAAPRLHHQWLPDEVVYEPDSLPAETLQALKERGHTLTAKPRKLGDAQAILVDGKTGTRSGASDPRASGASVGY